MSEFTIKVDVVDDIVILETDGYLNNIGGEKINSYHQQNLQPGIHEFHWTAISASGTTIPSGIYFYTIESNGIVQSKKLIFIK